MWERIFVFSPFLALAAMLSVYVPLAFFDWMFPGKSTAPGADKTAKKACGEIIAVVIALLILHLLFYVR